MRDQQDRAVARGGENVAHERLGRLRIEMRRRFVEEERLLAAYHAEDTS